MFARRKKASPRGGSWRRRRLMRGDQSPLTQRLQSLALPPHKKSAKPHSAKNLTSPNTKNFPHVPAISQKQNKSSLPKWRGHGGSSGWVREVWRVGRPLRKGSPCASKVFPLPLPHFLHTSSRRGDNAGPVRVIDDKARLRTRRLFDVFCKRVVHLRVRRARRRRGSL